MPNHYHDITVGKKARQLQRQTWPLLLTVLPFCANSQVKQQNRCNINNLIISFIRRKERGAIKQEWATEIERTNKIRGQDNIFEASITMDIRMTWQYTEDGILLRNIGKHDKTLKNP